MAINAENDSIWWRHHVIHSKIVFHSTDSRTCRYLYTSVDVHDFLLIVTGISVSSMTSWTKHSFPFLLWGYCFGSNTSDTNINIRFECNYEKSCQRTREAVSLQWRHNDRDGASNHRRLDCLLSRLFKCRSKKTSRLFVTGLCEGNHRSSVDLTHKWPVTRKMFPRDDVIMMTFECSWDSSEIE